MKLGYETKDGKRIVAFAHISDTAKSGSGALLAYQACAADGIQTSFELDPDDVQPFLAAYRRYLAGEPIATALPEIRTAADVLALMPPAARQVRTEVRVVDGIAQGRMIEPKPTNAILGTFVYLPGKWHTIGLLALGADLAAIQATLDRLREP